MIVAGVSFNYPTPFSLPEVRYYINLKVSLWENSQRKIFSIKNGLKYWSALSGFAAGNLRALIFRSYSARLVSQLCKERKRFAIGIKVPCLPDYCFYRGTR